MWQTESQLKWVTLGKEDLKSQEMSKGSKSVSYFVPYDSCSNRNVEDLGRERESDIFRNFSDGAGYFGSTLCYIIFF